MSPGYSENVSPTGSNATPPLASTADQGTTAQFPKLSAVNSSLVSGVATANTERPEERALYGAGRGSYTDANILSLGLALFQARIELLIELAHTQFESHETQNDKMREAHAVKIEISGQVKLLHSNSAISTMNLSAKSIALIEENQVEISGITVLKDGKLIWTDKDGSEVSKPESIKFTLVQRESISTAVGNYADRLNDTNFIEQLRVQKTLQNYNVASSTINSFQIMMSDMLKYIISNIRA